MAEARILTMARLADHVYQDSKVIGDWTRDDRLDDGNFMAALYVPSGKRRQAIVSIRGSANWQDWVIADGGGIGLSLNAFGMKLNSAIDFTSKVKATFPDVWVTGHSLGGAFVQLVAAICEVPGMTFNAPGVLNLVNQMSSNPLVSMIGGLGGGVLSTATLGLANYFNMAAAAGEDAAFQSVLNYRGEWDPVSKIGVHVGAPISTIQVASVAPHPHSMEPIIRALSLR